MTEVTTDHRDGRPVRPQPVLEVCGRALADVVDGGVGADVGKAVLAGEDDVEAEEIESKEQDVEPIRTLPIPRVTVPVRSRRA